MNRWHATRPRAWADHLKIDRMTAIGCHLDAQRNLRLLRIGSRPCRPRVTGGERRPLWFGWCVARSLKIGRGEKRRPVNGQRDRRLIKLRRYGAECDQAPLRVEHGAYHPRNYRRRIARCNATDANLPAEAGDEVRFEILRALAVPELNRCRPVTEQAARPEIGRASCRER